MVSAPSRLRFGSIAGLLLLWLWTPGCDSDNDPIPSSGVETARIEAEMRVESFEPGEVRVEVQLEREDFGANTPLLLAAGETLMAWYGGVGLPLARDPANPVPTYAADFSGAPASGAVQVIFYRSDGEIVTARVSLPPDFVVTSPWEGHSVRLGDGLLLEWTPELPGEVIRIWLRLECPTTTGGIDIASKSLQVDDDGIELYDLGLLAARMGPDVERSRDCTLESSFERREWTGWPFSSWPYGGGGSFSSKQARSVPGVVVSQ